MPARKRPPGPAAIPPVQRLFAMNAVRLDAATAELMSALGEAGVEAILLKGRVIAERLYGDVSQRPYGDVDLLVPRSAFESAEAVLAGLGYRGRLEGESRVERDLHDATVWKRERPIPVTIDLHRSFSWYAGNPERLWEAFSKGTRGLRLADVEVHTPSDPALLLILAGHALQHAGSWKTFADLECAARRMDRETWREAAKLAASLGARDVFAAGLAQSPECAELVTLLGLGNPPLSPKSTLMLRGSPPVGAGLLQVSLAPSRRAAAAVLLRKVFPSSAVMRAWNADHAQRTGTPVTSRSGGLAGAHLRRILWLLRSAPRGLRAFLAARRS